MTKKIQNILCLLIIMSLQSFGQKYLKIMNKAQSYMDKKKYDKAIKLYDKVIELNPNYSSAFGNRAIAKAKKNNHKEAIIDFDNAIAIKSKTKGLESLPYYTGLTYFNRGLSKRQIGDFNGAIADFTEAANLNYEKNDCLEMISVCKVQIKNQP